MRTFEYFYNQLEVTVKINAPSGELIAEAKFPTPSAAKNYYEQTMNWVLSNNKQPNLTSQEIEQVRNLVNTAS